MINEQTNVNGKANVSKQIMMDKLMLRIQANIKEI